MAQLYTVKDLSSAKRAELVETYNNMEKDCFQETVAESAVNKTRLANEILVAGNANNTKYLAIAEYKDAVSNVLDAAGATLQEEDHLGTGHKQWWLNEVCRSYNKTPANKQKPSPVELVVQALEAKVCGSGAKELYLMVEINPKHGNAQKLIDIYSSAKYGFVIQLEKDGKTRKKIANGGTPTWYYMKKMCSTGGGGGGGGTIKGGRKTRRRKTRRRRRHKTRKHRRKTRRRKTRRRKTRRRKRRRKKK